MNNPTNKTQTRGGGKVKKNKKQNDDGKTGKKKIAKTRYKDPSKMCWDVCPMYAYDVIDVNKPNKHILLVITCILWCFSIFTVCVGAYLIKQRQTRQEVISAANFSDFWLNFSLVLLCNGILSSIITFCGFIGVLRENIPLLRVFYISLIVALLLKFSLAVFVLSFADYSRPLLEGMLAEQAVVDYRASSDVETLMDYLQTTFRCCGLRDDGLKDWSRNIYFNCSDSNPSPERCGVPWSCCRNHTGITNPLCGHGVQKLDRNIASRTIHTMGCLRAIHLWVFSHAIVVGLVVLLEVSVFAAVTFQCTRLVNELQMMNGVYRGPWWDRISTSQKSRPRKRRRTPPPSTAAGSQSPRPPSGPSGEPWPSESPSEVDQPQTKLPMVMKIGHGPAVRITQTVSPARSSGGPPGSISGQPSGEAPNQQPSEPSSQQSSELVSQTPSIVVVNSDGQVISGRVFATTFRNVAGTDSHQTELSDVAEMLESAAENSFFRPTDPQQAVPTTVNVGSTDSVDSVAVEMDKY